MSRDAEHSGSQTVTPLIDTAAEIPFRDERTYLHGTDIYRTIASCLEPYLEPAFDRFQLKFRSFASSAVRIVAHRDSQRKKRVAGTATFSLSCVSDGSLTITGSVLETDKEVRDRKASVEQDVIDRCEVAGDRVSLRGPYGFSPIDALVFSTKALHQSRFPSSRGKWIFASLDIPRLLDPEDADQLEVIIRSVVRDRFTECSIRSRGQDHGTICFSVAA